MDTEIFILLKSQAIDAFVNLIAMREYAKEKGLLMEVDRINASIAENKDILSLANKQLFELNAFQCNNRIGLFDMPSSL